MEINERYFELGELSLHALVGPPAGPPLVMLHGATGCAQEWLPVIPHLAQRWQVYAPDLRGHGKSGRPADRRGYHISHNVADTLSFLRDHVQEPAVLMGHSYGAVTSMLSFQEGEQLIRALVLEDPPLVLRRHTEVNQQFVDYFSWAYRLRQSVSEVDEILAAMSELNLPDPPENLRQRAQNIAWLDPEFAHALVVGDRRETVRDVDFAAHARAITCPVLLLQADPAIGSAMQPEDVEFFLENVPHTRLEVFSGAGHGIHTDQPGLYLQVVDEFLGTLA